MWYPAVVAAPTAEPVSLEQVKAHSREFSEEADAVLMTMLKASRAHIEAACGARFATRTGVQMICDGFSDLERLPEAPVSVISSISYVDTSGATQTLSSTVYELRASGLEAAIVLKYGQSWPATQPGSRIIVTATVGGTIPEDVAHAILMLTAHFYDHRSAVGENSSELPFAVNSLICNHRRGV